MTEAERADALLTIKARIKAAVEDRRPRVGIAEAFERIARHRSKAAEKKRGDVAA